MEDAEKCEEAELYLEQFRVMKERRADTAERIAELERTAAFLGCADLDGPIAGKRYDALLLLKESRRRAKAELARDEAELAELEALAEDDTAVQVAFLHRAKRLTWEQVAARTWYSFGYVRKLEDKGLLAVWERFVKDIDPVRRSHIEAARKVGRCEPV